MRINFKNRYKFYYALGWIAILDHFTKVFFSMGEEGVVQKIMLYPCRAVGCSEMIYWSVWGFLQIAIGMSILWFVIGYFSKPKTVKENKVQSLS